MVRLEDRFHGRSLFKLRHYLRNSAVKMSPTMAAGLSKTLWDVADIVKLVEAHELKEAA